MSSSSSSSSTHPSSYASLNLEHIKLSHVPVESITPTPVIVVTLYRPKNHNAFTEQMAESLIKVFGMLGRDERVKVIVVTGNGNIFCAGADLEAGFNYKNDTASTHRDSGGRVSLAIHQCPKPVIGALNGSAVGVGITMTLPMTIRIASSRAKIGFVFARRGIIMEACSSFFLPRLIGYSRALHLVTTGEVLRAHDPLLNNLFSEVIDGPPEAVLTRALEIADMVARNTSGVSTTLMRDLIWRGPGTAEETHLLDSEVIFGLFGGKDNEEGVRSFMEKREARFKGTVEKDAPDVWPWWEKVDISAPVPDKTKEKGERKDAEKVNVKEKAKL